MLPGLTARRQAHPDQYRNSEPDRRAEDRWRSSARARWASSSRRCFNRFGTKVTRIRNVAAHRAGRRRGSLEGTRARASRSRGIRVETGAKSENIEKHRNGVSASKPTLANGKDRNDRSRKTAGRDRPQAQHREHRPGEHESRTGSRLHQGEPVPATGEPGIYAIGDMVAGTPQLAHVATMRGHGRRRAHRRQTGDAGQSEPHSRGDLHRAGHRQRRADRSAGARRRATT